MKKIILLFSMLAFCFFCSAQTLSTTATTVSSGSIITIKGAGETAAISFAAEQGNHVWNIESQYQQYLSNQSLTFVSASYYNKTTGAPTSLEYKLINTAPVAIKVTYKVTVMPFDYTKTKSLPPVDYIFTVTVTPATPPQIFWNVAKSKVFYNNTCSTGYASEPYTYNVPAHTFSAGSQTEADQKAQTDIDNNGQYTANNNTTCKITFYNTKVSKVFTPATKFTSDSSFIFIYDPYTYTVNAEKYSASTQAAADALAQNEINTKGQASANVNGSYYITEVYWNTAPVSAVFIKNDCTSGGSGSAVTYTIPARKYYYIPHLRQDYRFVMQAIETDMKANGQNYANTHGTCSSTPSVYVKLFAMYPSRGTGIIITAYFYADATASTPVSVNGLPLSYNVNGTNKVVTSSGASFNLESISYSGPPSPTPISLGYSLTPSTYYNIIN